MSFIKLRAWLLLKGSSCKALSYNLEIINSYAKQRMVNVAIFLYWAWTFLQINNAQSMASRIVVSTISGNLLEVEYYLASPKT